MLTVRLLRFLKTSKIDMLYSFAEIISRSMVV